MDVWIRCINRSLIAGVLFISLPAGSAHAQSAPSGLRVTSPDGRNNGRTFDVPLSFLEKGRSGGQAIRIRPAR
jgi:hypothetical protein